ncbi:MAG TPA: hypothetical protein EYG85_09695 [Crocinitomix sp.]|nr:hypothetical protein [Crocinitomix sp.]
MKLLPIILTLIFTFNYVYAQQDTTNFSYYFKNNTADYQKVNVVPKRFYGIYELKPNKRNEIRIAAGDYFIIDSSGIYISKNNLISITKEEVRENGKYNVKNGYLFGVKANDSIPVVLQKDKYYFLIPVKSYLYSTSSHVMYKINSSSFIIFSKEDNGYYSVIKIDFNGHSLKLSELELNYKQINSIKHEFTKDGIYDTYLLTPKKSHWELILNTFIQYDEYIRK